MEKRGTELSMSTIVVIILALLVLIVVLIIFWGPARSFFTTVGNQMKNALNLFDSIKVE